MQRFFDKICFQYDKLINHFSITKQISNIIYEISKKECDIKIILTSNEQISQFKYNKTPD